MEKLFYVPGLKITAKIADTVIDGQHIEVDGDRYERVSKRPTGRRVMRRLRSIDESTQITIYS
jgi:hypothetical protein